MHKMCILNNPGCAQKSLKSEGGAGGRRRRVVLGRIMLIFWADSKR